MVRILYNIYILILVNQKRNYNGDYKGPELYSLFRFGAPGVYGTCRDDVPFQISGLYSFGSGVAFFFNWGLHLHRLPDIFSAIVVVLYREAMLGKVLTPNADNELSSPHKAQSLLSLYKSRKRKNHDTQKGSPLPA